MTEQATLDGVVNFLCEGTGQSVLLIHGVGADLHSWDRVAGILAENFRVIRADLRGHGRSHRIRGGFSLEQFAWDNLAVLDQLGVEAANVVGFSLGGLVAQSLCLQAPQRVSKMILVSAVGNRTAAEKERVLARLETLRTQGIRAVTEAAKARWFTEEFKRDHPEKIDRRIEQLIANDPESYNEAYRILAESDLGSRLSEVTCPTFLMTGELDEGSNPRMSISMHGSIAGSQVEILPGLKHNLLLEVPDLIADRIQRFVREECRPSD